MSNVISLPQLPETCSECGACTQSDQIEYFREGEFRWYSRVYECGKWIRVVPGYIEPETHKFSETSNRCRQSKEYKAEQEKRQAEIDKLHKQIDELDISADLKIKMQDAIPKSTKMKQRPF